MFVFEDKFLPLSNFRYRLNKFGEILELNGAIIETEIKDCKKLVKIDWYAGNRFYEIASIIAIVKFNINIPVHYWDKVEPIFNDGDWKNTNISNISYRFKDSPLEVLEKPGYYHIPYHTNYAINNDGVVVNLKTNHILTYGITKPCEIKNITGGYYFCSAIRDIGSLVRAGRHRLMGFTFLTYNSNPLRLVINHKDGTPGNDHPSNLEWVTRKQNNQHAYDNGLFPNKVRPVIAKNWITGYEQSFINISKCSQVLNIDWGIISTRMGKNKHIRYADGWVFKEDDGNIWPELGNKIRTSTAANSIIGRNIFTDEYIIFDTIEEAARHTGVCEPSVRDNVRDERIIPINGFNFRYNTVNVSWPNHSEKHLLIYKRFPKMSPNGVLVTDSDGNELEFYESFNLAAKAYKCHLSSIVRLCKHEQTLPGKIFHRYRLTENLGPSIE